MLIRRPCIFNEVLTLRNYSPVTRQTGKIFRKGRRWFCRERVILPLLPSTWQQPLLPPEPSNNPDIRALNPFTGDKYDQSECPLPNSHRSLLSFIRFFFKSLQSELWATNPFGGLPPFHRGYEKNKPLYVNCGCRMLLRGINCSRKYYKTQGIGNSKKFTVCG